MYFRAAGTSAVSSFMATESTILEWKAQSLPSDNLSIQNAVIIANSQQVPFVIDPNNQAVRWLKEYLLAESKSTEEVTPQATRFANVFENAVRFGRRLIVKE